MKKNVKIDTIKLLAGITILANSFAGGDTLDLTKDFSNSLVSSIDSVFEPLEVYASEQDGLYGTPIFVDSCSTPQADITAGNQVFVDSCSSPQSNVAGNQVFVDSCSSPQSNVAGNQVFVDSCSSPQSNVAGNQVFVDSCSSNQQPPSAPKVNGIKFKIGQTTDVMDVAPYVENGNTMIPVRAMATLLGITDDKIVYDSATNKVTITYYERVISLNIGDNKLYVTENGTTTTKTMDNNATAVTKDWRTFVPVRALSEAFGLQVGWDNDTQTVTLSS